MLSYENNSQIQQDPKFKNRMGVYVLIALVSMLLGGVCGYTISQKHGNKMQDIRKQVPLNSPVTPSLILSPTFSDIQRVPLDNQITYVIPQGWKKITFPVSNEVEIRSVDYAESAVPSIESGAKIRLEPRGEILKGTLVTNALANAMTPLNAGGRVTLFRTKVGSFPAISSFSCWEGCVDAYYFLMNNLVWDINFECAPNCDTKDNVDRSKYASDRNSFLKSIKVR